MCRDLRTFIENIILLSGASLLLRDGLLSTWSMPPLGPEPSGFQFLPLTMAGAGPCSGYPVIGNHQTATNLSMQISFIPPNEARSFFSKRYGRLPYSPLYLKTRSSINQKKCSHQNYNCKHNFKDNIGAPKRSRRP